jgi:toxin ParE1/3/4
MPRSLRFSDLAMRDLEAIGDRIALDNPRRAKSFVKELRRECNSLREMPERFAKVRRYSALRKKVHGNYLILYDCDETNVEVIRILHGAMDYEAILFPQDGGEN